MIPLYTHANNLQGCVVHFPIPGSEYEVNRVQVHMRCTIVDPCAYLTLGVVDLQPKIPAGMLSREKAIVYLKFAWRNEIANLCSLELDMLKEQNVRVLEEFIDRLLEAELKERRRVAMAKKIQRVFRAVVANPEYQMCKRRLLREYDDLIYRFS